MPDLRVLDGSTFCICDEIGDIVDRTHGLFARDTRYLSRLRLTIGGKRPLLLSSGTVDYFSAAFFLRNPLTESLPLDSVSIRRERFVGDGMQDVVVLTNETASPLVLTLAVEVESDFADIISVKEWDFSLGDPRHAKPLPEPVAPDFHETHNQFVLVDPEGFGWTYVGLSQPGRVEGGKVRYEISLDARETWELRLDVLPREESVAERAPLTLEHHFGDERSRVQQSLAVWQLRVPQIRATWDDLKRGFSQSVDDLAALRIHADGRGASLPAAGCPWFMTVFGRDTLITCLQTFLFGPELAAGALRELIALQATDDDPSRDAEPGKIVHEVRSGKCALRWFDRYYGSVDATPLFLVLLSELWRWTDDAALMRELKEPALAALRWIDHYGDRDGDGFVEYQRRTPRGLENQSWKDSGDSQRFRDGRIAEGPIAPCEVQGYVYDAKLRTAEIAREVWRDPGLALRLQREAETLRERFDEAYWCEERGGYYALALDGEKQRVDSLCSNVGHLLWSGIVPDHRAEPIVDRLMGEEVWTGWGMRTMSTGDAGYNPLSYHNGTVWPHDTSLCAWGLARYGYWTEAHRVIRALVESARSFRYQLPEVFAGLPRARTPFPIAYPTAARPQAWAAGTPVLLLRLLLGIEPDRQQQLLRTIAPPDIPSWAGRIRLAGVRAFGRTWDVRLERGAVSVDEA